MSAQVGGAPRGDGFPHQTRMYGALDAKKPAHGVQQFDGNERSIAEGCTIVPTAVGSATSAVLQLCLWVGTWGLVDVVIARAAPARPEHRFLIYGAVAGTGGLAVPLLMRAQKARWTRGGTGTGLLIAGFVVAVALCSGLWGMLDSVVEAL